MKYGQMNKASEENATSKHNSLKGPTNHYDNSDLKEGKLQFDLPKTKTNLENEFDLDRYLQRGGRKIVDHDPDEFEKSLEKDFDTLLRYERKFIQSKNESERDVDGELIRPFDDLRFKRHTVLPFNIN